MGPRKRKKSKQHGNKKVSSRPVAAVATTAAISNLQHQHPITNLNSSKANQETLFRFIEAGGKKCYELFQYLSSSTHWRKYGTLPPLSDEEAAMLNHMYQLWLQHHHQDEDQEKEDDDLELDENSHHEILAHSDVDEGDEEDEEASVDEDDDDNDSSLDESHGLSVGVCVSTIKETLRNRTQYSDSFMTLLTQLDLLMKSPEPCRTQASDLLEIFMLPEFLDRDINSLEKMFESTETHPGYISACSLALGLLSESEHRLSSSLPSYEAYNAKKKISPDEYFNSIALSYYLKSNVLSSQLSPLSQSPSNSHSDSNTIQQQHNVIACMLLGSLFLRGSVVDIPPERSDGKTTVSAPNYQAAFDYYKISAMGHNPIAEHKVGYFYDEGLPNGVCNVDIIEAVKWYSVAAELMPDSMHNLAKIYEDGRGGFEPDMTQAVTLYSVAAARGFPLSQVNLGRLFLLGEDGVTRDREAGKRLLTLAAESGDADAQMVVGMIHATPAFECYDLALSEHWLRQSLAGGKLDAERLLTRVLQQMDQVTTTDLSPSSLEPNPQCADAEVKTPAPPVPLTLALDHVVPPVPISQNAVAAKRRGDDFVYHGLLHAAVLEYSRAFELDRTKLSYFVDRLDALCILGHYEECLTDSSLLLLCVDSDGLEYTPSHLSHGSNNSKSQNKRGLDASRKKEVDFFRAGLLQSSAAVTSADSATGTEANDLFLEKMRESQEAMNRLYDILVESLGCLFSSPSYPLHEPFSFSRLSNRASSTSGSGMNSADTGGLLDSYNSLYDQTISSPSSELWPFSFSSSSSQGSQGTSHDENGGDSGLMGGYGYQVTGSGADGSDEHRQQYQQVAEDYMFNLHQHHRDPMICRLLQDCMDWELKSTKSSAFLARLTSYDRYYTCAVIRSGGIPILLSVLSYPSQLRNSLSSLSLLDANTNNSNTTSSTTPPSVVSKNEVNVKKHILHEQLWLNCAIILHNLSFSHMAKKVMHLLSATDGFPIMCNCLRLCRDKILTLSSPSSSKTISLSLVFRRIALARTSTSITQILLSSACLGKEEIWDELMVSDLIGGILAALECALVASQIESYQERINFLQHLQHVSFPQTNTQHQPHSACNTSFTTKKLQTLLSIRESCLEEGDRILMDTVHTLARLLKIAPSFVLTTASGILMIPFQRILVAITSHPNHSDQIHESLKSATAFCLCKLLCARDPRNAEILQQSLTKDGIRDILVSRQQQQHSNGHTNTEASDPSVKQIDSKSHQPIPLAPPPPPPPIPASVRSSLSSSSGSFSQPKSSKQQSGAGSRGKKKNSK